MNASLQIKTAALAALLLFTASPAEAQRRHRLHRGHHTTTIVARPVVTIKADTKLTRKDRLGMALAWLAGNPYLTAKKYAKMTGLSKEMAKAELDAFAQNPKSRIKVAVSGKKRRYTL